MSGASAGDGAARRQHHEYWDSFYAGRSSEDVPEEPSPFATWVASRLEPGDQIVELGFGTARDSLWFAEQGHPVRGYDFAESAVAAATEAARARGLPASFSALDLYDEERVGAVAAELAAGAVQHLYGRFLIHSLEPAGRAGVLDLAAGALRGGGSLFLEFRTGLDAAAQHVFGDGHFRVYLDPEVVIGEIESRGGRIRHHEQGHGLAVYRTEDPHIARVVASWTW